MDLLRLKILQRPGPGKVTRSRNALVRDLFVVFLLTAYGSAKAATISATSCEVADVRTALNRARAGDTVVIPAGSANWAEGVSWNPPANVTVKGAGTSDTGGGDNTIIIDNYASNQPLLRINVSSVGVFRMTGITFRSGTGTVKYPTLGLAGSAAQARIDHCHFDFTSSNNYRVLGLYGGLVGVMDHCRLDLRNGSLLLNNGRRGPGEVQGNLEWSLPTNFGSANYFFIEDSIITGGVNGNNYTGNLFDGFTGAKVVVRFNDLVESGLGETHATGHSGDDRGLRSQEAYGNKMTSALEHEPNFSAVSLYGGTALVWGNSWDNVFKNIFRIQVVRRNNVTYGQAPTPTGWGYAGTQFNGTGSNWDGGTVNGTDTVTGYPCLDQPGRGQGDLLTGGFPNKVNSTTGTIRWPNQALEPIYIWNNTGGVVHGWGDNYFSDDSAGRVVANRDYYPAASGIQTSATTPFDGTSGTGWGTLANRPTTCTPGVAYFATDQGSWNKSDSNPYGVQQNGADGVLYKCTAPDTWTLYYTPYTYPHPLQAGASGQPAPPTGLRIESP